MAVFVVAHGGWSGGWAWKKMRPLMASNGHELHTPTYTGLGDRAHLAHEAVDLETHIADVFAVLEYEDLTEVYLIGHSYGGMVATGVADRARKRIAKLIYLDALAPDNGKSAADYFWAGDRRQTLINSVIDGWRVPPQPLAEDTAAGDLEWAIPKRVNHPLRSIEQKLRLQNGPLTLPRSYIYCTKPLPGDPFRPFFEASQKKGWPTIQLNASHSPNITAPNELMVVLNEQIAR